MRGKSAVSSVFGQGGGTKASMRERKKKQEDELLEQTALPSGEEVSKQMWQLVGKANLERFLCDLLLKSQAAEQRQPLPASLLDAAKNDRFTFGLQSPRSSDDIVTPIFEKASSMKLAPSFEPDNHAEHKDIPLLRAFSEQPHEHKHSNSGFSFTKISQSSLAAPLQPEPDAGISRFGPQSSEKKASPVAHQSQAGLESLSKSFKKTFESHGQQ